MDAIVFAAGRGTRLRPATDETPKPLLEVGGEPLLRRCLDAVVDAGVDHVVVVVGYRADEIVDAIGDSVRGASVTYASQRDREGLAHAVRRAAEDAYDVSIPSGGADPFAVTPDVPDAIMTVCGDNVFDDCALSRLREHHAEPGVDGTILLDRAGRNEATAKARCDVGPDGTVRHLETSIDDAPTDGWELDSEGDDAGGDDSTGGYVAAGVRTHHGPSLIEACRTVDRAASGEYELTDALERLVDRGSRYVGVELEGWHLNVNTPADLEVARRRFRRP
ncbi:sugar phosphate nucleotidyltransferase [Halopiger goleimassiliensis]|uniref:sugar phosphate nucleotidyltransferase n=1 Tax=Halopiger goleimassiliensis TaxID=1293048 RepID=UPI00067823D6|nr:sugar phosphate nucleotidyltransferase [Halopiger goleimassiliensis]